MLSQAAFNPPGHSAVPGRWICYATKTLFCFAFVVVVVVVILLRIGTPHPLEDPKNSRLLALSSPALVTTAI